MEFVFTRLHNSLLGRNTHHLVPLFPGLKLNPECELILNFKSNIDCAKKYALISKDKKEGEIVKIINEQLLAIKETILDQIIICNNIDRTKKSFKELDYIFKKIAPLRFYIPKEKVGLRDRGLEPYLHLRKLDKYYNRCSHILNKLEAIDLMDQRECKAITPSKAYDQDFNHISRYSLCEQLRLEKIYNKHIKLTQARERPDLLMRGFATEISASPSKRKAARDALCFTEEKTLSKRTSAYLKI